MKQLKGYQESTNGGSDLSNKCTEIINLMAT